MEEEEVTPIESETNKKVRHRKKQLYKDIRKQMEFYFSDANLSKNRFIGQLIQEDPFVDLTVFMGFNKIKSLTTDIQDVASSLKKSEFLKLNEECTKVARITPFEPKQDTDECTIYVEQLPPDVTHEWLKEKFSSYGEVVYVSIPKYKTTGKIKGFAFVEFDCVASAQKTLQAYVSMGCCLPSQMPPEELCSINAFHEEEIQQEQEQEDNNKTENETEVNKNETKKEKKMKKKLKRKLEEIIKEEEETITQVPNENPEEEKPTKRKKLKANEEEKEEEEIIEEKEDTGIVKKKKKNSSIINETEKSTEEENANKILEEEEKKSENLEEKENKKKRRRKKKKKVQIHTNEEIFKLQIMSKQEWKRLRNKYLELQKNKMKNLKQYLNKVKWANNPQSMNTQQNIEANSNGKKNQKEKDGPHFQFIPGIILKIDFEEPIKDVKNFKLQAQSLQDIKYIDIAEGANEAYIRFSSNESAINALEKKLWENTQILNDKEEKNYWEKMHKDREERFKNRQKPKIRGRTKLLKRAEKALGKHIRFD